MARLWVVVVAERPTLAGAVVGLLESEGIRARTVPSIRRWATSAQRRDGSPPALVVCASNAYRCSCSEELRECRLSDTPLIVLGSRDPSLHSEGRVHLIELPIVPARLLGAVRELLEPGPRRASPRDPSPPGAPG